MRPQRDLRNRNAQVIAAVREGESFVVTRDGVPVADVVPHLADGTPPCFPRVADLGDFLRTGGLDGDAWLADVRALDDEAPRIPRSGVAEHRLALLDTSCVIDPPERLGEVSEAVGVSTLTVAELADGLHVDHPVQAALREALPTGAADPRHRRLPALAGAQRTG